MRIDLLDGETEEVITRDVTLRDVFPDEGDEAARADADNELRTQGRCWIGGGAAKLFLLMHRR